MLEVWQGFEFASVLELGTKWVNELKKKQTNLNTSIISLFLRIILSCNIYRIQAPEDA